MLVVCCDEGVWVPEERQDVTLTRRKGDLVGAGPRGVGVVHTAVVEEQAVVDVMSVCESSLRPPDEEDEEEPDFRVMRFQRSLIAIFFFFWILDLGCRLFVFWKVSRG